MEARDQRRLLIFGAGALIGAAIAFAVFSMWRDGETKRDVEKVEIALTSCELKAGDVLREDCVEPREVAYYLLPPESLRVRDLDWHVGRVVEVDLEKGSVLRTVDFAPRKANEEKP